MYQPRRLNKTAGWRRSSTFDAAPYEQRAQQQQPPPPPERQTEEPHANAVPVTHGVVTSVVDTQRTRGAGVVLALPKEGMTLATPRWSPRAQPHVQVHHQRHCD
jgi:hypothetical protein